MRLIALLAALSLHALPARALTVDEVVAKNLEARGGATRLRALRSLRLTGKLVLGQAGGMEGPTASLRAPGRARDEFTLQGLTQVDGWDGKEAWTLDPFQGRRDASRVPPDEAKETVREGDLGGPLLDWREKGHRVEYLGLEDVDGTPAHKLRVALKDGDTLLVYLDADWFLEIRVVTEGRARGVERVREADLGSYAQVAGLWFPLSVEQGGKGQPRSVRVTWERVEVDVPVDDALFRFPAPGAPIVRSVLAGPPAAAPLAAAPARKQAAAPAAFDAGVLSGLGARNLGPAVMSGRVSALAARNADGKTTLFVGAASGGVWRSLDGGTTFKPVFDQAPVQSIGAIAIDPTRPETIWVGTGESWVRNSVSAGDGVYKSTDGGATWTNVGLAGTERVSRILVHPRNGEVVWVCAPGRLWSDDAQRGLFKTTDGGKTWAQVLKGPNLSTGCSGLAMDPADPEVLIAGLWDFRRKGWTFRSGGEGPDAPSGSGLYRTADGGRSWTALAAATHPGLPPPPWGRVEVAIAPSDGKVVYALIEGRNSGLYRSSDGGATWEARDKSQGMVWRPFYFARLVVDPRNAERVFKAAGGLIVSDDGGRSFSYAGGGGHGDWHDLWIDPDNTRRIFGGDDGGLWSSLDGGSRWWKLDNLPIAQFYHVAVDDKDPYQVYGGLQDNSSWVGPSAYPGGITSSRWENLYGGDGFWVLPDPTDPEAVYAESQGGYLGRVDRRTLASRDLQPKALPGEKLRFNWNTPLHLSPNEKGTLYLGAQLLFRTRDRGETWERISPDLTTNDPARQQQERSGGITVDNSSAEMHTTLYSISESPLDSKTTWAGTDDGNLQLTRDGGKVWTNVAPNVPGLPARSWVSWVEAGRHAPGTAWAAFDRHMDGDPAPWVFRTADFGKTWTRIAAPAQGVRGWAHCIKEDPVKPQLLYLGTEAGLWISADGGKAWAAFKGGDFPAVAVRELQVHPREHDLVIATHGRGLWIVDDLTPLRALGPEVLAKELALLPGRPAQQRMPASGGWVNGDAAFVAMNPAGGAVITYYQRTRHLFGPIALEVFDAAGKLVDTLTATKRRGLNRVTWSMRLPPPRVPRAASAAFGSAQGPRVLPGTYTVRLTKGGQVAEAKLEVTGDRRAPYGLEERKAQLEAMLRVHALFGAMSDLVDRIDAARAQRPALAGRLDELKKKIVATKEGGAITGEERLREHADLLYGALAAWEGRPTADQLARVATLQRELGEVGQELEAILK